MYKEGPSSYITLLLSPIATTFFLEFITIFNPIFNQTYNYGAPPCRVWGFRFRFSGFWGP